MGLFSHKKNQQRPTPDLKPARRAPAISRAAFEAKVRRDLEQYELDRWAQHGIYAKNWDELMEKLRQREQQHSKQR